MRHDFEQMRRSDGEQAAADAALWNYPDTADALQFAGECFASQPGAGPARLLPLAALCFRRAAESDRSKSADVSPRIEAVEAAARHAAKRLAEQGVTPPEAESSNRSSRASAEIRAPGANSSTTRGSEAASRELTPESIARLQALFEAGNQHAALGRHAEAEQAFRQVVEAAPSIAVAHFNLANACFAQGKIGDAAEAYFHCLRNTDVASDDWQLAGNAWNNLGNLRTQQASPRQAWDAFSSAVACDPTLASAWWNLGRLAADDGAAGTARLCFTESIRLSPPRRIEPRLSLAKLLFDAGRVDAALAVYDEILAAAPNAAPALKGRAFALLTAGRVTEAVHDCLQVIQATPDDAEAFSLLARANRARGQLTEAQFCDLKSLELAPRSPGVRSHFLDLRQFDPAATLDEFLDLTTHWNDVHGSAGKPSPGARRQAAAESSLPAAEVSPRKLRLAYLGPDLDRRRTADWLAAILPHHDRERFEVWGYGLAPAGNATESLLRPLFDRWRSVGLWSDLRLEQQLIADEIDILIDVVGHGTGNRLPLVARRPVPVVGRWLGFPGTTGVKGLDFFIADWELVSKYDETRFVEPVRRVAGSQFILPGWADAILARATTAGGGMPNAATSSAAAPPAARRADRTLTLACFSPLVHITGPCLKLWARVLAAVPGAQLWLASPELADSQLKHGFEQLLVGQGIPADRFELSSDDVAADDETLWQSVDLLLDPIPYGDSWSAAAAIVRGIPVVTLCGERFATRKTASLLKAASLTEWVAESMEEYLERAIEWCENERRRLRLRAELPSRLASSQLVDRARLAREIEAILLDRWPA